jgi:type II secretory ATPase GspE/PulE/Tfp pilus assembly ATPase PilB-like protein
MPDTVEKPSEQSPEKPSGLYWSAPPYAFFVDSIPSWSDSSTYGLDDESAATEQATKQVAKQTSPPVLELATAQVTPHNRELDDYLAGETIITPEQLLAALDKQSRMPMIRVGEALLRLGYINQTQLDAALEKQKTDRSAPLGQLLLGMGFVTQHDLNTALVRKMGYPVVDPASFPIDAEVTLKVSFAVAQRLHIMPLMRRNNMWVIAMTDPTLRATLDELEFILQARIAAVLADTNRITKAQQDAYGKLGQADKPLSFDAARPLELVIKHSHQPQSSGGTASQLLETLEQDVAHEVQEEKPIEQSDNSLVRLVNQMIVEAHAQDVSDIHIETRPSPHKTRIRFRRDGVLSPYLELPHTYKSALLARLKIMADLDISERRKPQDGKIDVSQFVAGKKLELRIATIPTTGGLEDVVMRLLSSAKPIELDRLGLSPTNFRNLRDAISRPYGMVLCVGPTGSGKTTTLHSVLGHLNTPQRKIWTAEDPIEITQPDLRQVQVNPKIGWTFAKALRSFLRADPDVIMVGEIRDQETAQIAIEASLTGHLVLSTLHTNSAAETVTRLIDMGMDPFNFADSLLAVLAQRLVRRLCPACRKSEIADPDHVQELIADYLHTIPPELRPTPEELEAQWIRQYGGIEGKLLHYSSPGCPQCHDTGLRGRVGLHELLLVSPGVRRLIQTSTRPEQIQQEGFRTGNFQTLRQDGICKVLMGQTTIEEVRANSNNV